MRSARGIARIFEIASGTGSGNCESVTANRNLPINAPPPYSLAMRNSNRVPRLKPIGWFGSITTKCGPVELGIHGPATLELLHGPQHAVDHRFGRAVIGADTRQIHRTRFGRTVHGRHHHRKFGEHAFTLLSTARSATRQAGIGNQLQAKSSDLLEPGLRRERIDPPFREGSAGQYRAVRLFGEGNSRLRSQTGRGEALSKTVGSGMRFFPNPAAFPRACSRRQLIV